MWRFLILIERPPKILLTSVHLRILHLIHNLRLKISDGEKILPGPVLLKHLKWEQNSCYSEAGKVCPTWSGVRPSVRPSASLNACSRVYLSKVYFWEMYPTCVSSKLYECLNAWRGAGWKTVFKAPLTAASLSIAQPQFFVFPLSSCGCQLQTVDYQSNGTRLSANSCSDSDQGWSLFFFTIKVSIGPRYTWGLIFWTQVYLGSDLTQEYLASDILDPGILGVWSMDPDVTQWVREVLLT